MDRAKYLNRLGLDIAIITLCFIAARLIFPNGDFFFSTRNILFFVYIISFWYFAIQTTFLYQEFLSRSLSQEFVALTKAMIIQDFFMIIALFFMSRDPMEAKWFVIGFITFQVLTLPVSKYYTRWYYSSKYNKGKHAISLLIIGAGEIGMNFNSIICNNYQFGYKVAGFVDDDAKPYLNGQYLGRIEELDKILHQTEVNEVIIALPNNAVEKIRYAVEVSEDHGKRVRVIPDYVRLSSSISMSTFGALPLISLRAIPLDSIEFRFAKRTFDVLFSLALFVGLFSWLFPILMILIKLTSKGPIFFVQERWGISNKKISCYKFRSMVTISTDVDENGKYQQACKNDPRITPIGRFLRKTNLDELPQFLNVLKGEMSVIGPRPHPTPLNVHSRNIINNYMLRHLVKPGITGWAQVHGYRGETKDSKLMQKRIDFDIWYIENWNFWLDCQIIIQTVINMIKGDKNAF